MNHIGLIAPTGFPEANPNLPPMREPTKRNLFDRTSAQPAAVLQYTALTCVNSVVCVDASRRNDMCAEGRLLSRLERPVARPQSEAGKTLWRKFVVC
jgi:hypothetical protein